MTFESIPILLWIFSQKSDLDAQFFLGYSLQRWAVAGIALFAAAASAWAWRKFGSQPGRQWFTEHVIDSPLPRTVAATGLIVWILLQSVALYLGFSGIPLLKAGFTRLLPLLVYLLLLILQIIIISASLVNKPAWDQKPVLRIGIYLWITSVVVAVIILMTRFSLEPVANGWYEYGVPLTSGQILALLYGSVLVLSVTLLLTENQPLLKNGLWRGTLTKRNLPPWLVEGFLMIAIWAAASIIWLGLPIVETWMSPKPFPPNFEVYPHSDALFYDSAAQGIFYGTAWAHSELHYKPFYVMFLTVLHSLVGGSYTRVIIGQTLFLALFPAALYIAGKMLAGRLAGILIASAAIMRESNQLAASPFTTLSNSKLLLSELPTALGITALLIVLFIALKQPRRGLFIIIAGVIVGLLIQIRLQTILFLPALMLFFLFHNRKHWLGVLARAGYLLLGFIIAISPLIIRNAWVSGAFAIEKPGYFEQTMDYSYGSSLAPAETSGLSAFIASRVVLPAQHFIHNTVSTMLTLPSGLGTPTGWSLPGDISTLFWIKEHPPLNPASVFNILSILLITAFGLAAMWHAHRWVGLLPAWLFAAYNLSSALGGFSGQRFILPVDWAGYFYFCIGFNWLVAVLFSRIGWDLHEKTAHWILHPDHSIQNSTQPDPGPRMHLPLRRIAFQVMILALPGMLFPAASSFLPIRYPQMTIEEARIEVINIAQNTLTSSQQTQLKALIDAPDTILLPGIALYPRAVNDRQSAEGVLRYAGGSSTYPVLGYLFQGNEQLWVLHPFANDGPSLPHASGVIVAGRYVTGWRNNQAIRAYFTVRLADGAILLSSDFPGQ